MIYREKFPWVAVICTMIYVMTPVMADKLGPGSTREEVITAYGAPSGSAVHGKTETLLYSGGSIEIKNGKIVSISPDFEKKTAEIQKAKAFEAAQKAKGLIKYRDQWMTPEEKQRAEAPNKPVQVISNSGKLIDIKKLVVPGAVTVLDFYADWCGPCRHLTPKLERLARNNEDVYLCKIDIVKWNTPVSRQYRIRSIPHVRVYDGNGTLIGKPTSRISTIRQYIDQARK